MKELAILTKRGMGDHKGTAINENLITYLSHLMDFRRGICVFNMCTDVEKGFCSLDRIEQKIVTRTVVENHDKASWSKMYRVQNSKQRFDQPRNCIVRIWKPHFMSIETNIMSLRMSSTIFVVFPRHQCTFFHYLFHFLPS